MVKILTIRQEGLTVESFVQARREISVQVND